MHKVLPLLPVHSINRRYAAARKITAGKTYVHQLLQQHRYQIEQLRRDLKRRVRPTHHSLTCGAHGAPYDHYRFGTFTVNGQVKQMASTDLTADTQGTRATVVPEGILLQTSGGEITLIVTKIEDESHLNVNQDRVSIVEDTNSVVTAADRERVQAWRGRVANDGEWERVA